MKTQAETKRYRSSWDYLSAQVKQHYPELNIFERVGFIQELLMKGVADLKTADKEIIQQALIKSRNSL